MCRVPSFRDIERANQLVTMMRETWRRRVKRAEQLSAVDTPSRTLVAFYAALLRAQGDVYEQLTTADSCQPSGDLETDLSALRPQLAKILSAVATAGSDILAIEARRLLTSGSVDLDNTVLRFWRRPADDLFFAKAIVQPYAQRLAECGVAPVGRERERASNRCPFCGGAPQLSVLCGASDPALEGGARALQCATCLMTWPFRRALCPQCGEEDERKLGYFTTPAFDHLRLETCETCKHYLKGVDLTRLGLAVPLVDEVAGAPLDAWATEHGFVKIELNLVGL
jgi:formate dehydrogenase maturation protein FdhE